MVDFFGLVLISPLAIANETSHTCSSLLCVFVLEASMDRVLVAAVLAALCATSINAKVCVCVSECEWLSVCVCVCV